MVAPQPSALVARKSGWSFVAFVATAVAIALAMLGPRMAPVRSGNAARFWVFACDVDLDATRRGDFFPGGTVYLINNESVAYEDSNLHGSDLYSVPMRDVVARFDAVASELERRRDEGVDSIHVQAYAAWREANPTSRDVAGLLEAFQTKRRERYVAEDIDLLAFSIAEEHRFWQRWHRARWYWANFAFEWTFLTGLALFAVWPSIRGHSRFCSALHLGLIPLLFMLPCYLGYASLSLTSAGPSGGIVYPWLLLSTAGGTVNQLDQWLLERLPQVLEPLSTPIGTPLALTGAGMHGPTAAIVAGAVLAATVLVISEVRRARRGDR